MLDSSSTVTVEAVEEDKPEHCLFASYGYGEMIDRFGVENFAQEIYSQLNILDDRLVFSINVNSSDMEGSFFTWIKDITR